MKESYKVKTSHPLWPRVMRGRGQLRREAFTGVQPGCVLNSENNNRAGHRAGIETGNRLKPDRASCWVCDSSRCTNACGNRADAKDIDFKTRVFGGSGSPLGSVVTFLCCGVQQFRDFLFLFVIGNIVSAVRFAPVRRTAAFFVYCSDVRARLKE